MIYKILLLFIITFVISCELKYSGSSDNKLLNKVDNFNNREINYKDTVKECNSAIYLESKIVTLTEYEISNLDQYKESIIKYFGEQLGVNEEFSQKDVKSVKKIREEEIHSLGTAKIYSVEFSEKLPEVALKKAILVINEVTRQAALLPIQNLKLIKLIKEQKGFYIGGNFQVRAYGFFVVYDIQQNLFKPIFDTGVEYFCSYGIPVTNYSLDCYCYDKFKLNINNIDKNSDALPDLHFTGKILHFCQGLERGYGRKDRKPLSSTPIEIIFYADENKNTWIFKDTVQCEQLNSYR